MRKISKAKFFLGAAIAFTVVGIIAYTAVSVYQYYFGMQLKVNKELVPVTEAYEYNIIYKGEYDQKAIIVDDYIYLDMNVVNEEWAREMLFYAEDVNKILYTTYTGMEEFDINGTEFKMWNDVIYINAETARGMFGLQYTLNEKEKLVAVQDPGGLMGEVTKSGSYLLVSANEEERGYTKELKRGEVISLFETEIEGFYYAMSHDGYTGYISEERVKKSTEVISQKIPAELDIPYNKFPTGPISIGWHQLYSDEFTYEIYEDVYNTAYYVDVVSPTWFKLNEKGGIDSLANAEYVTYTKDRGKQVWALFDNQFDDEITYNALSSTENRQKLCETLLEYCKKFNLNGINVDFENISEETYGYYIQFLRELSITLRSEEYILSVDVPVPSEWTDYYRRDLLYELCDFVVVMAYDEYYAGSDVAGSVASRRFTTEAIYNMMQEGVSADKLVLGIPFFTRVWMGVEDLRSDAVGMDRAWTYVYDYGLEVVFDEKTGQNYAEGLVGDTLYRIWLEDNTSIDWRLQLVLDNDLAGVAAWSLGLESSATWIEYEEAFYS